MISTGAVSSASVLLGSVATLFSATGAFPPEEDAGFSSPPISAENLKKLLKREYPTLRDEWAEQFSGLFEDIRKKCDSAEISTKALDLRGLMSSVQLMHRGLTAGEALRLGVVNKAFDPFERRLVEDVITARIPSALGRAKLFDE